MALPAASPAAKAAKWRQLVDILAQAAGRGGEAVDGAFGWLREHRADIPRDTRRDIAAALAGRSVTPALIRFFAEDHPTVAGPLLGGARLRRDDWLDLLPALGPTARALLRHRRDLDAAVVQALASFGPSDFVLSGTVAQASRTGETQIRELVERIEAFRRQKAEAPPAGEPDDESPEEAEPILSFRWETGPEGVIVWVEDAPRGALVGQSIASIAGPNHYGVDGQAAGAFEKRAPFRDARFSVAGAGPAAGDWRISGVPFFDAGTGSFEGYRGTGRRPRIDEFAGGHPAPPPSGLFGTDLPPDSLRQLIHELRTPLNAIVGFAEMIDGEFIGPADAGFRARAAEIIAQAGRLLSAVDDLDTAARIETSRYSVEPHAVDAADMIGRIGAAYGAAAAERRARIDVEIGEGLPPVRADAAGLERMFARLLAATIGLAGEGETIAARMSVETLGGRDMVCLAIARPRSVAGLDEAAILDPGYSPEGDWPGAPALGLGFALRLVRNLAEAAGGALIVAPDRFLLYLPPFEAAERSTGQKS